MRNNEISGLPIDYKEELASLVKLTDTLLTNPDAIQISERLYEVYAQITSYPETDSTVQGRREYENDTGFLVAQYLAKYQVSSRMHGDVISAIRRFIERLSKILPHHQLAIELEQSSLFDSEFYLKNNIDVANSATDPAVHFIAYGNSEGRTPSQLLENIGL